MNATTKTSSIAVRVEPELRDRLQTIAKEDERSIGSVVRLAVRWWLREVDEEDDT